MEALSYLPHFRSPRFRLLFIRYLCGSAIVAYLARSMFLHPATSWGSGPKPTARLAKAVVAYPSLPEEHKHILNLHDTQNKRFNYNQHILCHPIMKGSANILHWLSALISHELQQPVENQVEWLLYFDSSTIPMHPDAPLDFLLPPTDNVDVFETFKDLAFIFPQLINDTLSSGVFWLRTSATTLAVLTEAVHELHSVKVPLDNADAVALALQHVLEHEMWSGDVVYQPGEWYGISDPFTSQPGVNRAVFRQPSHGNAFTVRNDLVSWLATGASAQRNAQRATASEDNNADISAIKTEVRSYWDFVMGGGAFVKSRKRRG